MSMRRLPESKLQAEVHLVIGEDKSGLKAKSPLYRQKTGKSIAITDRPPSTKSWGYPHTRSTIIEGYCWSKFYFLIHSLF